MASEVLPSALAQWNEIEERLRGRRAAVFLDYDGTLTPIVDRPEDARLPDDTRAALERLGIRETTVIVSGRGRADVTTRVGLGDLYYAGSHGFDIAGPGGLSHEAAPHLRVPIEDAFRVLVARTKEIPGVLIEDKRFSVSVHYRLAADAAVPALERLVDEVVACDPRLRKSLGKKVFEVRPLLDWDKGKALLWLLRTLGLDRDDVVPIYVGDDVTDEDAFAAIRGRGIAVLVSDVPRATAADHWLRDPAEVCELLQRLARRSPDRPKRIADE